MAGAATAAYSADILTSPRSVDTHDQDWAQAVPLRKDSTTRRPKSRSSHDSAPHAKSRSRHSRDRNSKGSRSSSMSRHHHGPDSGYLTSARGRRDTSRSRTRKGSEASSYRDVYGQESASRSAGNLRMSDDSSYRQNVKLAKDGLGVIMNGTPEENWIHRDKLARIESEELHQAAIMFQRRVQGDGKVGRGRISGLSGSSAVTTPPNAEQTEPWPDLHEEQGGYTDSPATYDGHDVTDDSDPERRTWDLRRPEEIAAADPDDNASKLYHNPTLRKSSSRIPISTVSPAPLSPDQGGGREFRSTHANGDEDSLRGSKSRRASEPFAVDSPDTSGSRPGSRGATRKTPGKVTNRKNSAPAAKKTTPKSRTTSGANTTQRPTTRSGETRPTTAVNRPEGDPPWLATMYKPDPRLPPDQQMLPTHAKKMQQELWAKEGKMPTAYDRDFAPLAIGPDSVPPTNGSAEKVGNSDNEKVPPEPTEPATLHLDTTWPLKSPKSPEPGTRPTTASGYSPMPRLQDPPSAGLTPKWTPPVVTAQEPPKKEKSCGCCIVM